MKLKNLVCLILITLVASISPAAHAQTFLVIHAFNGVDGARPFAGVTIRAGVLYGTTRLCRLFCVESGNVYQLNHVGSSWGYSPLFFFSGQNGAAPAARVVFGPDNHLYGTTQYGGFQGAGIAFNLTPPVSICKTANCFFTENVLYQFPNSGPDGHGPDFGDLIWDPMGNIYGTTGSGGIGYLGTVFKMTKSGNNWTEEPLHSFTGDPDGDGPLGGVILDSNGNLFGTTSYGGLHDYGTVFELTYANDVGWTETVLYNFSGGADGRAPFGGLISDGSGNYYGTTNDGGSGGCGTVFELSPTGQTWTLTTLYSFSGQTQNNCGPWTSLTMDTAGNLYGTTYLGGANQKGNVFELSNTPNGWVYTSLYDFTDGSDGAQPISNVTIDTDGTLYGTASEGGSFVGQCAQYDGCGTVWMIKP